MFRYLIILNTAVMLPTGYAAEVSSPRHSIIASDKGKVVRYDAQGKVVWEYSGVRQVHTLQQLENGNVLCQKNWQTIIEVTPTVMSFGPMMRRPTAMKVARWKFMLFSGTPTATR